MHEGPALLTPFRRVSKCVVNTRLLMFGKVDKNMLEPCGSLLPLYIVMCIEWQVQSVECTKSASRSSDSSSPSPRTAPLICLNPTAVILVQLPGAPDKDSALCFRGSRGRGPTPRPTHGFHRCSCRRHRLVPWNFWRRRRYGRLPAQGVSLSSRREDGGR